jgi:hypothetical protein
MRWEGLVEWEQRLRGERARLASKGGKHGRDAGMGGRGPLEGVQHVRKSEASRCSTHAHMHSARCRQGETGTARHGKCRAFRVEAWVRVLWG